MSNALAIDAATKSGEYVRDRSKAIIAARSHSRRVLWLKRFIVLGSFGSAAVLAAVAIFDPFSAVPGNVSIASASLNGTKITMELPRLNGFRKDGKPYQVRARSGIQDVRSPKVIELNEVEARIQMENDNSVNVVAPSGIFDSGADLMKLFAGKGGELITLKSTSGFLAHLRSADVNLKAGTLTSQEHVFVSMPNGKVDADRVDVADGGKVITFIGNVKSLFNPAKGEGAQEKAE